MRKVIALLLCVVLLTAAAPAMAEGWFGYDLFNSYSIFFLEGWEVSSEMADMSMAQRQITRMETAGESFATVWVETFEGVQDAVRSNMEYLRSEHGVYDPSAGYFWVMQSLFSDESIYIEPLEKAGTINGRSIVYRMTEYLDAYVYEANYFNDYVDGVYIEFVAYKEEYDPEMAEGIWLQLLAGLSHVEDGVEYTFEEYVTPDVVITADSAKVRSEASLSGGLLVNATNGMAFPYVGEEGDWYIIDVNGQTGYVHKGVAVIQ